MAVLVIGGAGFIGAAVIARLLADGLEVVATTRRGAPIAAARWVQLDLRKALTPEAWTPLLEGVDAVINCAGVLQDGPRDSTAAVHVQAPAALYEACVRAGVRRVILISAIGADADAPTAFARTKHEGELALKARDLDWVILRPSVVLGRAAYGGSALMRGLAALPLAVDPPNVGPLQVVRLEDVADTAAFFVKPGAPARVSLDLAGPDRLSFSQIVADYRRWFGWPAARRIAAPGAVMRLAFLAGDLAGVLGWRAPMRTTARLELARGSVGDPSAWIAMTGVTARAQAAVLMAEPASVQERWFAKTYFLKPMVFVVLPAFWIVTAAITLGPGFAAAERHMQAAGLGHLGAAAVAAGALADLIVGGLIAVRSTARLGLKIALGLSAAYLAIGTLLAPQLWIEPLGPLVKILPIMALHIVALILAEDR